MPWRWDWFGLASGFVSLSTQAIYPPAGLGRWFTILVIAATGLNAASVILRVVRAKS
jgi:hypothetical protein